MISRRIRLFIATALTASIVCLAHAIPASASFPSPIDSSFGTNGVAIQSLPLQKSESVASSAISDSSGNLYVLIAANGGNNDGRVSIAKYTSDGAVVSGFGTNGRSAEVQLLGANFVSQSNGKIIVGGFEYSNNQTKIVIYRFTSAGQIDSTFGENGSYSIPSFPGKSIWSSTLLLTIDQSNDRIYLGFDVSNIDGNNQNFYFIALYSDGGVDDNWGNGGAREVVPRIGSASAYSTLTTIQLLSDGSLLGIGSAISSNGVRAIVLTKINQNGYLDATFDGASNGNGIVFIQFGSETDAYMTAATILQDDSVVLAGAAGTYYYGPWYYGVAKVLADGTVDTSFGANGFKLSALQASLDSFLPTRIGVQNDGRYVFPINSGSTGGFMRIETNGTFGNGPDCSQCLWSGPNDGAWAIGVLVQSDGKVVVTGQLRTEKNYIVRRFTIAGVADNSFSNIASQINSEKWTSSIDAVKQLADGSILGLGFANTSRNFQDISRILVYKFTSNGVPNPQFGSDGYKLLSPAFDVLWMNPNDFVVQPDGKIVILASGYANGKGLLMMWRIDANGTLDNTFGTNGFVSTSDASADLMPTGLVVTSNGNILVILSRNLNNVGSPWVYRYLPDGTLDSSFTDSNNFLGGKNPTIGDGTGYVNYVLPTGDGKFLIAGNTTINSNAHSYLARFLANGTLDATFSGGYVAWESQLSYSMNYITSAVVDGDGSIFVFGQTSSPASTGIVYQLNSDGSKNNSFNGTGYKVLAFRNPAQIEYSEASDAVINNGTFTIIGGGDSNPQQYQSENFSGIARMSVTGTMDSNFGTGGFIDPFSNQESYFSDIEPLSNGVSLIAGMVREGSDYNIFLMKIGETSTSPATTPTTPPTTAPPTTAPPTTTTNPPIQASTNNEIKLVISVSQSAILKRMKLTVPKGAKVSMKVTTPKVCRVSKSKVIASATGTCRVRVTVTNKKKKKTTKSTSFKVT